MMACTSPAGSVRFTPLRMSRSSTRTRRSRISRMGVVMFLLSVLTVRRRSGARLAIPVVDRRFLAGHVAQGGFVVWIAGRAAEYAKLDVVIVERAARLARRHLVVADAEIAHTHQPAERDIGWLI